MCRVRVGARVNVGDAEGNRVPSTMQSTTVALVSLLMGPCGCFAASWQPLLMNASGATKGTPTLISKVFNVVQSANARFPT